MNDPQIHRTHAEEMRKVLDDNERLTKTLQERSYLHPLNMAGNLQNIQALLPADVALLIGKDSVVVQHPPLGLNSPCTVEEVQTTLFALRIKADPAKPADSNTDITKDDAPIPSALNIQEGGSHYKDLAIQPVEYIHKNRIGFVEGCVIKYVTRWRDKGGLQDLRKARHFLDLLLELEGAN
jgi:hypothetical protein